MQVHSGSLMSGNSGASASRISDAIAPQRVSQSAVIDVNAIDAVTRSPRAPSKDADKDVGTETAGQADDNTSVLASLSSKVDAKLDYDRNTAASQGAIGHYLLNQHAAQREAISDMVGIDTYV